MTPKQKRFIRQIKAIDPKAAEYIKREVFPRYFDNDNEPPLDLPGLFIWKDSPQGGEFWTKIFIQIRKQYEKSI